MVKVKIGRDAKTGQFVPVKETIKRPATTVVETIKRPNQAQQKPGSKPKPK